MDKYGYTADRYSFRLVSLSPSNATLKVTALDENYSWTLKFSKNVNVDGTWDRDFDQMAADSKELDEIEVVLKGMMSGMIHEGYVYYNKEEGNKYRELVKKYNLKHPSSPLKAS